MIIKPYSVIWHNTMSFWPLHREPHFAWIVQMRLICSRSQQLYDIFQNDRRDFSHLAWHQIPTFRVSTSKCTFFILLISQRLHLRIRTARSENSLNPATKILSENHENNDVNPCIGICKYVNPIFQVIKPIKHGPSPHNVSFQCHWCCSADCKQCGENYEHAHGTQIPLFVNLFRRFLFQHGACRHITQAFLPLVDRGEWYNSICWI